jgi:P pilus assembly chaperone PapD
VTGLAVTGTSTLVKTGKTAITIWFEVKYTPYELDMKVDNTTVFTYTENRTSPVLAVPPIFLIVGGNANGSQASSFSLIVNELDFGPY